MEGETETWDEGEELNHSSCSLTDVPQSVYNETLTPTKRVKSINLKYNDIKTISDHFCSNLSSSLTHLHLKGNKLESLPTSFGLLAHLKYLDASENSLRKLPETFPSLAKLETLKLVSNKLQNGFLETVESMVSLKHVHLDENRLQRLPSSFELMEQLVTLDVANNKLKSLPKNIGKLRNLRCLNVSNNKLDALPDSIETCPSIEELDVSYNDIKFLPTNLASASKLKKLYVDRNLLCDLPNWFSHLESLEELSLENNHLQAVPFPDSFGLSTSKLKHFNLGGNFVCELPSTFGEMKLLEFVHFGSTIDELERREFQNGNWLATLPISFGYLVNVKHLRLDENQLVELPESFGELVSLETLDLGQNKIKTLPESFSRLRSLKICLLSKNFLEILPTEFGNLKNLTELRLDNNLLSELPKSFENLTQLVILDLFNNRLTTFPSCLHCFTKLKYLELDENKFDALVGGISRMNFSVSYAARNPELKNNWRGRNRRNILVDENRTDEEMLDENETFNGCRVSTDQLETLNLALQQGSAIWRTHGEDDNKLRYKFDHSKVQQKQIMPRNGIVVDKMDGLSSCSSTSSCSTDGEEEWTTDYEMNNDIDVAAGGDTNYPGEGTSGHFEMVCTEDWDKEMDDSNPFHVYESYTSYRHHLAISSLNIPYEKGAFCPAIFHAKPIQRCNFIAKVALDSGLFDDADEN